MGKASRFLSSGTRVALAIIGVVFWATDHAGAQVRSASRHEAQERADTRNAIQGGIASLYDPAEMARAMELGTGVLRGTMGVRDKQGIEGLLTRLLKGNSVALADREWVFLLPMTPHVTAWFEAHNADDRRLGEREIGGLNPEVWRYAGRVRTDAKGRFQFDGLMPGRYLVLAYFPVGYTAQRTYATGEYSVEYSYSPMFGSGSGAIKPVTRTERYQSQMYVWISEIVDVKPDSPTIFTPPVRDLI